MKKTMKKLSIVAALFAASNAFAQDIQPRAADDILTGDTRLACEAILCLSSSSRPSECAASLKKYYSLRAKKWHQTVTKRKNFLKLCPASNDVNIDKIANSRSACDRGLLRRLDKCLDKDTNNLIAQGYDKEYQKAIDEATEKHKEAMEAMNINTTETPQESPKSAINHEGWGDGSTVFENGRKGGLTLDSSKRCVHWAGSEYLPPNSNYKITFSRLGSSIKETANFTTGQSGGFSLCLANTMFDSKAKMTLTDTSGNVIYQMNSKSAENTDKKAVETELKRFNEIYNRTVSAEEKAREEKSGVYWIK